MKKLLVPFLFAFFFALFLLVSLSARAQTLTMPAWTPAQCSGSHLLNAVPLNGAEATRTFTIGPRLPTCGGTSGKTVFGYNKLVLFNHFDFTAVAGTITTTCYGGPTAATATYYLTTCTLAAGTCTLNWSGVSVTAALGADTKWEVLYGIKGNPVIRCVVAHGGAPGATDTITVDGYLFTD